MTSPGDWEVGLLVLSGRPNPTWRAPPELGARLDQGFATSPALTEHGVTPGPGYRGAFARDGQGATYVAFRGSIVRELGGHRDAREDPGRSLERLLVASAPASIWSEPWARLLVDEGLS